MRKLRAALLGLSIAAALCLPVAARAQVAEITGPQDPSQLRNVLNDLIRRMNTGQLWANGGNAMLPDLLDNIGLGAASTPSFGNLTLKGNGTYASINPPIGVLHQGDGGLLSIPSNIIQKGDYLWVINADPSLYTLGRVSGAVTPGNTPGIRFTLNYPTTGSQYDFRYTVLGGDTNALIAMGICNAVEAAYNANTGGFKAALNNTLDQQGQGLGHPFQTGCANQVIGADMYFDQPWLSGTTASALNSGTTTVTMCAGISGVCPSTPRADGGPTAQVTRWLPAGYPLAAGDLGPYFNLQYRIGAASYAQIG